MQIVQTALFIIGLARHLGYRLCLRVVSSVFSTYLFVHFFLFLSPFLDFATGGGRTPTPVEYRKTAREHGERDSQTRRRTAREKTAHREARSQIGRAERLRRSQTTAMVSSDHE